MEVIRDLDWCPPFERGTAVTFGEFDGVHRGHRVVLLETLRTAVVEGCPTIVVTFDARSYVDASSEAPRMLTTFEQKLEIFEASEIDYVIELPADRIPRGEANDDEPGIDWIVDDVLVATLHARAVIVGEDYHFGTQRRRTIDAVSRRSEEGNFRVVQIPMESRRTATDEVVSAQSIRQRLTEGRVEDAAEMLGRPYEVRGTVAPGERRGRQIGFPTANLPLPDHAQVPAEGVYAARFIRASGERYRAAVNIGRRPTFHDDAPPLVEAHLLDFRGDLYDQPARLQFVSRIRAEEKFDGIDALRDQLTRDVEAVRERLPYV